MSTKLTNITGHYHSYVEDQVLTHYQLNETIDYFDDQNRLNRVFLAGTGIVCGFQVSINASYSTVTITQGNGITTDGDFIKLKTKPLTPADQAKATQLKQKLFSIDISKIDYKTYKVFDTDKANYPHFKDDSNAMLPIWELLPEKSGGMETGESLLTSFVNLKDYIVILYLENYTKDATLCDETDCSNKGGEEIFNLRVLVVSQTTANIIIGKSGSPERDSLYNKYDVFQKYSALGELGVKKVIPTFNSTSTANKIKQLFTTVINDDSFRTELKANITTILSSFGFTAQLASITASINTLLTIDMNNIPADIHYRYDLLKDVVATYKELKDLFIQLKSECNPPINSFPKHLLLGFVEDNNRFKDYRHQFYKIPVLDENRTFSNFDSLVRRLKIILDNYQVTANVIKITPSKTMGKLGSKSVPYYYNVDDNLLHAWDFEKSKIYNHKSNFSYHIANLLDNSYIKTPLDFCIDDHDFYRIEGYLNNNAENVEAFLNSKKKEYGLDFDFYILDVDENAADLKILFNTNYSFEHKAGVKKGGTLLLLKSGADFITDFSIDGKIDPDCGLGCCAIIGCLYPWISSLKYINNLARSLKGTKSKTKIMPTHYILNIRKYSINGINLINRPVIIKIPLTDILIRRLHVVMETLNTKFPTGLLFDFIEEEKKLQIMKLDKDRFEFEVQDITQYATGRFFNLERGNNLEAIDMEDFGLAEIKANLIIKQATSPVYKFTETGITRNGKIYRAAGITCSVIRNHNQDIYKKIHAKYDPINKDDDNFGRFNEDWKKWEILKEKLQWHPEIENYKRFINDLADFKSIPANNYHVYVLQDLFAIRKELLEADQRLNTKKTSIYIGGDWTNGNWVNTTMIDYYRENPKNTDDDIVLFINLRKKLHNETNTSKYMIHIKTDIKIDLDLLRPVFNKYNSKAEFYLQKPAKGNFIEIIDKRRFV